MTMTNPATRPADRTAGHPLHPLTPHLVCAGAADAIDFYRKAFEAQEVLRLADKEGRIICACLSINGSSVMLVDEFPERGMLGPGKLGGSPVTLHLLVDDVDRWVGRAWDAGGTVVMPSASPVWGDIHGIVRDPFGHSWILRRPACQSTCEAVAA